MCTYLCDLCNAEYKIIGYTSWHLHQCIHEYCFSAIGKHLKNNHSIKTIGDLTSNFPVLKKCNRKLDLLNLWDVHREEETKPEHANIGLYPCKTIILFKHAYNNASTMCGVHLSKSMWSVQCRVYIGYTSCPGYQIEQNRTNLSSNSIERNQTKIERLNLTFFGHLMKYAVSHS